MSDTLSSELEIAISDLVLLGGCDNEFALKFREKLITALRGRQLSEQCPDCHGSGMVSNIIVATGAIEQEGCETCDGTGYVVGASPPTARGPRSDWQTIASAPTDGSEVWLGKPGMRVLAFWDGGWRACDTDNFIGFTPTHWMPPPEPPTRLTGG